MKKCLVHLLLLFITLALFGINNANAKKSKNLSDLRILQLYNNLDLGGAGTVKLELQKLFHRNKITATTLILHDEKMRNTFRQLGLSYVNTHGEMPTDRKKLSIYTTKLVESIIKKDTINLVICHNYSELIMLNKIAQYLPIRTCLVVHAFHQGLLDIAKTADAVIAVSPLMIDRIKPNKNRSKPYLITQIYPLFDYKEYLHIKSEQTRKDFFKNTFNIDVENNDIILTSIANFYMASKNHPVLIKAFDLLTTTNSSPQKIHLMLAGFGPRMEEIKQLVKAQNLQDRVHFLGFTNQTPELLYHSDIKLLTSDQEGLPVTLMEACLMEKPIIGTAIPGIQGIIFDKETGLLFEKNNCTDLAEKIRCLINNPAYAKSLGENAFKYAIENCTMPILEEKALIFFDQIAKKLI